MVLHPFGHPRGEAGPLQVAAAVQNQFAQVRHAQKALDLDHFLGVDVKLFHDDLAQPVRRAGGDLEPDNRTPPAALQRRLEFAHQILGLVLDLQIAVAQHAKGAMADVAIAGKQAGQVHHQQVFQPQEPLAARQRDEPGDLLGDGQQCLHPPPVAFARQLQRQRKTGIGDKGERMGRVDGQRRQHRKHLVHEMTAQEFLFRAGHARAGQDGDIGLLDLAAQTVPDRLLRTHQPAGIGVDQPKLLGRGQPVVGKVRIALAHQFAQAGDPHSIEFVQIGGRNRQKSQPLKQRDAGVARLIQHAPVKGEPTDLAVEKPCGSLGRAVGQLAGGGKRGFQKIGLGHVCGTREMRGDHASAGASLSSNSAARRRVMARRSASNSRSMAATRRRARSRSRSIRSASQSTTSGET